MVCLETLGEKNVKGRGADRVSVRTLCLEKQSPCCAWRLTSKHQMFKGDISLQANKRMLVIYTQSPHIAHLMKHSTTRCPLLGVLKVHACAPMHACAHVYVCARTHTQAAFFAYKNTLKF